MKKKILAFVLSICFIIPCLFALTGCDGVEETISSNVKSYSITIINGVEGGKVLPEIENATKSVQVAEGDDYSVIVTPNEGYRVSGLLINGQKQNNTTEGNVIYTFENVSSNYSIAGVFEKLPVEEELEKELPSIFNITIINGVEGGKVLPEIENATKSVQVAEGEDYTVLISPDEGYKLTGLIINGELHENATQGNVIYTFENVSSNYSIAGVFEKITLEEEYVFPSLKLEGFIIRYNDSEATPFNDFSTMKITQVYDGDIYKNICAPENRVIVNGISRNGEIINEYGGEKYVYCKMLDSDVENDVIFFDNHAVLSIDYRLDEYNIISVAANIYPDSYSLKYIENTDSMNIYSSRVITSNMASIEFVFSTDYPLPI